MAIPIVSFTAGGIDVESIVRADARSSANRSPCSQTRQQKVEAAERRPRRGCKTNLDSLKSLANSVITNGVSKLSSSSRPSAVSASLSPFARAGSVTFTVDQLAHAHGLRTATTVASSSSVITTGLDVALSTNAASVGIASVQAGAGVTPGELRRVGDPGDRRRSPHRSGTARRRPPSIDGTNNTLTSRSTASRHPSPSPSGTYDAGRTARGRAGPRSTRPAAAPRPPLDATGRLRITIDPRRLRRLAPGHGRRQRQRRTRSHSTSARRSSVPTERSRSVPNPPSPSRPPAPAPPSPSIAGTGNIDVKLDGGLRIGDAKVVVVSHRRSQPGERRRRDQRRRCRRQRRRPSRSSDGAGSCSSLEPSTGTDNALALDATVVRRRRRTAPDIGAQDAQITIGTGPGAYSVDRVSGNVFTDVLQRRDAHSHRRVGDPCDRQRQPRRRGHRRRRRATHRRRQQPAGRHQAADRATTRRPRRLRR